MRYLAVVLSVLAVSGSQGLGLELHEAAKLDASFRVAVVRVSDIAKGKADTRLSATVVEVLWGKSMRPGTKLAIRYRTSVVAVYRNLISRGRSGPPYIPVVKKDCEYLMTFSGKESPYDLLIKCSMNLQINNAPFRQRSVLNCFEVTQADSDVTAVIKERLRVLRRGKDAAPSDKDVRRYLCSSNPHLLTWGLSLSCTSKLMEKKAERLKTIGAIVANSKLPMSVRVKAVRAKSYMDKTYAASNGPADALLRLYKEQRSVRGGPDGDLLDAMIRIPDARRRFVEAMLSDAERSAPWRTRLIRGLLNDKYLLDPEGKPDKNTRRILKLYLAHLKALAAVYEGSVAHLGVPAIASAVRSLGMAPEVLKTLQRLRRIKGATRPRVTQTLDRLEALYTRRPKTSKPAVPVKK